MIICNQQMETIMREIGATSVGQNFSYPITQKKSVDNKPYWIIRDKLSSLSFTGQLAENEWHTNEVWLSGNEITELVKRGLQIINSWQFQMEQQWPSVPFDIILSVAYGNAETTPNVTLRFWAIRNGFHYIEIRHFGIS